jgi:hypothetical protein
VLRARTEAILLRALFSPDGEDQIYVLSRTITNRSNTVLQVPQIGALAAEIPEAIEAQGDMFEQLACLD